MVMILKGYAMLEDVTCRAKHDGVQEQKQTFHPRLQDCVAIKKTSVEERLTQSTFTAITSNTWRLEDGGHLVT